MKNFPIRIGSVMIHFAILVFSVNLLAQQEEQLYFGQKRPGSDAEIFAPGIVNRGLFTRDIAITPDGREIYFCEILGNYTISTILGSALTDTGWTTPEVTSFASDARFKFGEPFISPDGQKFYFISNIPKIYEQKTKADFDIFVSERVGDGWSDPHRLPEPINSEMSEYFPSVARNGNFYFTREETGRKNILYRSRLVNGQYLAPERLPDQVNCGTDRFNAFIAPDESYLIVSVIGMKDTFGSTDYYIVFRNEADRWSAPVNMGDVINSASGLEYSPYVSPDEKYFFFMSARVADNLFTSDKPLTRSSLYHIYNTAGNGNPAMFWVDAGIIDQLKKSAIYTK